MITIKDVAKKAGVSITTVSMVLNNTENKISDKTRKKVIKAAKDLNYKPNIIAKSLVQKKSNSVLLVIPDITNPFFAHLAKKLSIEFEEKGYKLYIHNTSFEKFDEEIFQDIVDRNFIELSLLVDRKAKYFSKEVRKNKKIIFLDEIDYNEDSILITGNNEKGGYIATKFLLSRGYKNIAVVIGPKDTANSSRRLSGFLKCMMDNNLYFDPKNIYHGNYTLEGGYQAAKYLIKRNIDAVFCFNDMSAYGFLNYCKEKNIDVPNDLAIIGYDNLFFDNIVNPRLTSICQNWTKIAKKTAQIAEIVLNEKKLIKKKYLIEPKLIIRDSVGVKK
ncbi:MAG: LacI family DNA-binding transcriptional regulator [Tissierellia bacterium]|nr:LacI family DNA-binding transcriptional regulator [Tissierellia bacterium]